MSETYIFWGQDVSLFSGKVRAYLRYKQIPYEERTPGLDTLKREFIPRNGTHLIPVIYTPDGLSVQDTTRIIDFLEGRFPAPAIYPSGPRQTFVALLLESYGDGGLLPHAMHYRWNFFDQNRHVIEPDFGALIDPSLDHEARIKASGQLTERMRSMLGPLGINKRTSPLIEEDLAGLWAELDAHFEQHAFLLGDRPSIGDFGLMGSHYAHLYRDPHPGELMRRTAPALARWVERMNSTAPSRGDFVSDDGIPETLLPVLTRVFKTWAPLGLEAIAAFDAEYERGQGGSIPRFLPRQQPPSRVGVVEPAAIIPDIHWKLQRAIRYYQTMPEAFKRPVEELVREVGGDATIQTRIAHPLTLISGRIAWDIEAALTARYQG